MNLFFRVVTVAAVASFLGGVALIILERLDTRGSAGLTGVATMAVSIGYFLLLILAARQVVLRRGRRRLLAAVFVVASLGIGVFVFAGIAFIVGQPNTTGVPA